MIAVGVMIALFLVMGTLFAFGKGGFLIAGWNMMSPQEKARYDGRKVFRGMSALMFSLAGCVALVLLGMILESGALIWTGELLLIPCVIFFAVRVNRAEKK